MTDAQNSDLYQVIPEMQSIRHLWVQRMHSRFDRRQMCSAPPKATNTLEQSIKEINRNAPASIFLFAGIGVTMFAFNEWKAELEAEINSCNKEIQADINLLNKEIEANINLLNKEISLLNNEISLLDKEIKAEINVLDEKLRALQLKERFGEGKQI